MDDLFGEDPRVTAEQRFLLVLQERVDALTDEVTALRTSRQQVIDEPLPANVICRDVSRSSAAAFVKATLRGGEQNVQKFLDALDSHERVSSYGYFAHPSSRLFIGEDPENEAEDDDAEAVTVQALVLFDRTTVASVLGAHIAREMSQDIESLKRLEIGVVPGAWVGSINNNHMNFEWYMYHIVAGQCGQSVSRVCREDVEWFEKGRKLIDVLFMTNISGQFDALELSEDIEVWPAMPVA